MGDRSGVGGAGSWEKNGVGVEQCVEDTCDNAARVVSFCMDCAVLGLGLGICGPPDKLPQTPPGNMVYPASSTELPRHVFARGDAARMDASADHWRPDHVGRCGDGTLGGYFPAFSAYGDGRSAYDFPLPFPKVGKLSLVHAPPVPAFQTNLSSDEFCRAVLSALLGPGIHSMVPDVITVYDLSMGSGYGDAPPGLSYGYPGDDERNSSSIQSEPNLREPRVPQDAR